MMRPFDCLCAPLLSTPKRAKAARLGGPGAARAPAAARKLLFACLPRAYALGYLLNAPTALFWVVHRFLDRLNFLVHGTTTQTARQ